MNVPELGPHLGRMMDADVQRVNGVPLAALRLDLVSRLLARAGRARAAAATGDIVEARRMLASERWVEEFRVTSTRATEACRARFEARMQAAWRESRMSRKRLQRFQPDPEELVVLGNRLEATGIPLEVLPAEPAGDWSETFARQAGALQDSWDGLARVVAEEMARLERSVMAVRAWQRPLAPLWTLTVLTIVLALGLGLSLGGYLPAPGPLGVLRDWWWSLPWP